MASGFKITKHVRASTPTEAMTAYRNDLRAERLTVVEWVSLSESATTPNRWTVVAVVRG